MMLPLSRVFLSAASVNAFIAQNSCCSTLERRFVFIFRKTCFKEKEEKEKEKQQQKKE
jgi:hypothetical protein